ncbi:uncharacterized protein PHACADRAFT_204920 [Phanerochaete carnosa HHB-10118-sp]|uniref:Uncharacterized protein n=1 Tax=Phanerochaete carnosa (strain HHB-10118-sp) TaxID=650164 RepID=K5XFA0_PHACS|nr:uncharacterized protein PHACADRAFT_204920 [Phanerochaete carnosa HHB-10118-sp]EKM61767.1 hypothetical protein PHACADRAFT_204920 [Phanerochaete carnosa HHB-10118-sp]
MPDTPQVVYWTHQLILSPGLERFSVVFPEALSRATEHLGLDHQPSWFNPRPRKGNAATLRRVGNGPTKVSTARAKVEAEAFAQLAAADALTPPNSERSDAIYVYEVESTSTSPSIPKIKRGRNQRKKKKTT